MQVMAVDPGEKRIGIAISDPTGMFARPLQVLKHVSREVDADAIAKISFEHDCKLIVVGQALDQDGQVGYRARSSERLAEMIQPRTDAKVVLWDESNSTQGIIQLDILTKRPRKTRTKNIDARAAAMILDDYLKSDGFEKIKRDYDDKPAH